MFKFKINSVFQKLFLLFHTVIYVVRVFHLWIKQTISRTHSFDLLLCGFFSHFNQSEASHQVLISLKLYSSHKATRLFKCDRTVLAVHSNSRRYWTVISVREWLVSSCMTTLTMMLINMVTTYDPLSAMMTTTVRRVREWLLTLVRPTTAPGLKCAQLNWCLPLRLSECLLFWSQVSSIRGQCTHSVQLSTVLFILREGDRIF